MCYNCGCHDPYLVTTKHALMEDDLKKASAELKIPLEKTKENALMLLADELGYTVIKGKRQAQFGLVAKWSKAVSF